MKLSKAFIDNNYVFAKMIYYKSGSNILTYYYRIFLYFYDEDKTD